MHSLWLRASVSHVQLGLNLNRSWSKIVKPSKSKFFYKQDKSSELTTLTGNIVMLIVWLGVFFPNMWTICVSNVWDFNGTGWWNYEELIVRCSQHAAQWTGYLSLGLKTRMAKECNKPPPAELMTASEPSAKSASSLVDRPAAFLHLITHGNTHPQCSPLP